MFTRAFFHSAHYVLADSSSLVTASQTGSSSILDCLLKASPMDLSLPSIGRRYKFCLYKSYFYPGFPVDTVSLTRLTRPTLYHFKDLSPPFIRGKKC